MLCDRGDPAARLVAAVLATGLILSSPAPKPAFANSGVPPGAGTVVEGPARVVDGDTLVVRCRARASARLAAGAISVHDDVEEMGRATGSKSVWLGRRTSNIRSLCLLSHITHAQCTLLRSRILPDRLLVFTVPPSAGLRRRSAGGEVRIRMLGIDAPESKQFCTNKAGKEYPCGQVSAAALAQR